MTRTDSDLLEARLAARVAGLLDEGTRDLPAGVGERLRLAREQALARVARPGAAPARTAGGGRRAWLPRLTGWLWPGLGAAAPVAVLVVGGWLLAEQGLRHDAELAAAVDVALLADDLPPAAYADPGFVAFLRLEEP